MEEIRELVDHELGYAAGTTLDMKRSKVSEGLLLQDRYVHLEHMLLYFVILYTLVAVEAITTTNLELGGGEL